MTPSELGDLQLFMRAEYDAMKTAYFGSYIVRFISAALAAVAVFWPNTPQTLLITISAALWILGLYLAWRSKASKRDADRALNILFRADSLGEDQRFEIVDRLCQRKSWISKLLVKKFAARYQQKYYESTKPQGHERMLESLHESVFFTANLSRVMRNILLLVWVISAIGCIGVWFLVSHFNLDGSEWAQLASIVIMAVISTDMLGLLISYHETHKEAEALADEADRIAQMNYDQAMVLELRSAYERMISTSEPMLPWVYSLYRDSLNARWKKYLDS